MGVIHGAETRPGQSVREALLVAGRPWHHVLLPAAGFLAAFVLFAATLVSGVLSGDSGEFAYQPLVLGIPHPNGYPFYLLTGALWQRLVPFGEPAWKMNLFSAFWGALAVAWLVAWLRRALPAWGAALVAGLALALWPDFWRYSTAAAVYSLHAFFLVVTLERLHAWWERLAEGKPSARAAQTFFLAAGLGASNHLTFNIFLLALSPLVVALLRAEVRRGGLPRLMRLAWPLGVGALSYAYLPWRAWALGRPDPAFPELPGLTPAVARGLISPFYRPGLAGFLDYVLGRSLLTDLSAGWADVPPLWWEQVWRPLGPGWLLLAFVGLLALWRWHRGITLTLMTVYALSGTLALKYWRDFAANQEVAHVEGHLMAVHVIHVLLIAVGSAAIWSWGRASASSAGRLAAAGLPLLLFVPQAFALAARPPAADQEESPAIQAYWDEALAQPLAPGAGLMAHWGDLTPFWYQQHALGRRPDLVGLFPPSAELAEVWLRAGRPLYLAGPLLDWGADVPARFRLVPDGLFVRVELPGETPTVPEDGPRFGDARLVAHEVPQTWREGQFVALTLRWVAEAPVPRDMLLALRLRGEDGRVVAEWHRRFASLWDPRATLPTGQEVISRPRLPVPWGLPAGTYTLEMDLFDPATGETWPGIDEQGAAVTWPISVEAAEKGPAPRELRAHGFQGMALWRTLRLVGAEVRGDTFYPGQELPVTLTWLSVGRRPRQYTVQLRLVPADGGADAQVWEVPLEAGGRWPDDTVTDVRRQVVRLRLAPSVRAGPYRLVLALLRDGRVETGRTGLWRRAQDVPLADVIVAEYERLPHLPDGARPLNATFGDIVELLGYEWRGRREVTLYWRARREVPLNLSVFVHLIDEDGRVVAQADHVPQAGRAPTSGWWPGTVIPDPFALPVAPEPGWRLRVGLYDPVSGARLPLGGGDWVELPLGAERESP